MDLTPTEGVEGSEQEGYNWTQRLAGATWRSFRQRVVATLAFVASITGVLTFAFGTAIPRTVRLGGVIVSGVAVLSLVVFYAAKGIVTLAREGAALAKKLDEARAQVRSLNLEKQDWQSQAETPRRAARLASSLYGLVYHTYNMDCTLEDDGTFFIKCDLAMAATIGGIRSIEHEVVAPHAPDEWDEEINLVAADRDDKSVRLEPVLREKSANRLYWELVALPEFKRGHRINYTYEETLPAGSFAMTFDEMLKRGLEWEYFYVRIMRRTEKLRFSVLMPSDYVPSKWDYDVWFGNLGKVRHRREYIRVQENECWLVKRNALKNQLLFSLRVDDPIQGLYYVIRWQPPTE